MLSIFIAHSLSSVSILSAPSLDTDPEKKHKQRKQRLSTLLELRRAYSDILHAKSCLEYPSPVYQPLKEKETEEDPAAENEKERELIEQSRGNEALAIVAEMQSTSERLKASGLRHVTSCTPECNSVGLESHYLRF